MTPPRGVTLWRTRDGRALTCEFRRYQGWRLNGTLYGNPSVLARVLNKLGARLVRSASEEVRVR